MPRARHRRWKTGVWVAALAGVLSHSIARAADEPAAFLLPPTVGSDWASPWPWATEANGKDQSNDRRDPNRVGSGRRPGPNVPEPMVFDLIRPLGARAGEFEANLLGFVPLRRVRNRVPQFDFITGSDRRTDRQGFEWAPEVEYAPFDNFAIEFELPFAGATVEAYKGAVQYTLGTAFDERYFHALQTIVFFDRTSGSFSPTLLYIGALRFDSTYSAMFMAGFNHEFGGTNVLSPTQMIFNATLYAEVTDRLTLGIENNYITDLDGTSALLFMPQVHYDITERLELQMGAGTRAQEGNVIGEVAFRIVWEY